MTGRRPAPLGLGPPTDSPGFSVGRNLKKIGPRQQDTAELAAAHAEAAIRHATAYVQDRKGFRKAGRRVQNTKLFGTEVAARVMIWGCERECFESARPLRIKPWTSSKSSC